MLHKMARFLMWMASFFTMVAFWNYMDFAQSTWKHKNFLQVQSEHSKRLCNAIQSLEKFLRDMEASSNKKVLNKNQCIHLFAKLIRAMKEIDKMLSNATEDLKFQSIFEELCFLQKKVELVGKKCMEQGRWCHSAIFQLQNKETFRELLLDLKCCYNIACDVYLLHHPNQANNIIPLGFDAATFEQVFADEQELEINLKLLNKEVPKDYKIAQHLLLRLRNLKRVDGGDLDALDIPSDFKTPNLIKKIGEGGYGDVYESNWCGLTCATKVLKGNPEYLKNYRKEAGIMAGLSHPNLVQFLGCGTNKNIDEIPKEEESGEMHLVMELMETSLSTVLKKVKRPLPYHVAIDIMHQIAKGVYYLHDMQVAHLDLKPANILASSISMKDLGSCCTFKVTDYGMSKLEVCSNPKPLEDPKPLEQPIGTWRYMSPEMIKGSSTSCYQFQADVWSFAMICSEILSGKVPYSHVKLAREFYDQIKGPQRPALPNDCEGLTNLIQECWSPNPLLRPTFSKICERLTNLKKSFLKGGSRALRDFDYIFNHIPRVDELIAPANEIRIDLDHQVSKAKGLLKMSYIGIVGMGGIGKTTLAKAIFDDTKVNSSYHESCFVDECKKYQSSFDILCKILPKLGKHEKPKNLGDAQEMMKELLIGKKVLLILDDVNKEALVRDIVPLDIVKASKGTTVIITTRQWSTIKSFVSIKGRLDVEELDEEAATTLFNSHLSWDKDSLSSDFMALHKHIVEACKGLPLSLKVMGAFLRKKDKLRSWERALQRMPRGRSLDGDERIWNTLRISFDGLNDGIEKSMFLDMACFFCPDVYPFGISKAMILSMWSKDGIPPVCELERLVDMSLLKVTRDGDILEMHDQLRDMGRMIAKNTRIWNASMIHESGFSSKDVEVLEGISLYGTMNIHVSLLKQNQSLDFKKLRVLILTSYAKIGEADDDNLVLLLEIASQSSQLEAIMIRYSHITYRVGLPHRILTNTVATISARILDLCSTQASLKILDLIGFTILKQLPNKIASSSTLLRLNLEHCSRLAFLPKEALEKLSSLTTLNLSWCSSLAALPRELGNLSLLSTLDLRGCSSLATLPHEVGNLTSLTSLFLSGCSSLATLPHEVGNLTSLTTLDLEECSSLVALPKAVGNLTSLTTLDLRRCSSLATLPHEVGNLTSLTTLYLSGCSSLSTLPHEVGNLTSLTSLFLSGCSSLATLPHEVGNLTSLTTLYLCGCSSLSTLPHEVGNLTSLTTLDLEGCLSLVALPKEVGNLSSLTTLYLRGCSSLSTLPHEVGNLTSLTSLFLSGCSSLATLPHEVGNLTSLTTLYLSGCSSLSTLPHEVGNLTSLTTLDLEGCLSLVVLPEEVGNLSSLTTLYLSGCSSLATLPHEVGNLTSLTSLFLSGCSSLATLPHEVGNLTSLTTLYLSGCSSLSTLPHEVGNLTSLTTLDLEGCLSLVALPKEVGNLSSLTTLYLSGCSSLSTLPHEVGNLTSWTSLFLSGCSSLATLPHEVGNLTSLTTLYLSGCSSLATLPHEVGNLTSLTTLDLEGCLSLVALPKEVGNLSSLTTLYLSGCSSLSTLPHEVGNLTSWTSLFLSGCSSLATLPHEVGNLTSLTTLYLSGCSSLSTLPHEVGNLTSLTTLDLEGCLSLVALPKEVGNLSSLTTLYLRGCSSLSTLPHEVGNLTSLTSLFLSGCSSLATLPHEVGNLTSLTTLYLSGCSSLSTLPHEVGNLTSLTTLDLEGCSSLVALP